MTSDEKYELSMKLSRALADYLDGVGEYPMDYVRMPLAEYLVDEVLEGVMQPYRTRIEQVRNLFAGDIHTVTWRHGDSSGAAIECVEVPFENLQEALGELS